MAWFFADREITENTYIIDGEDAKHIAKSLRMKIGEEITLVTPSQAQADCVIENISGEQVYLKVLTKKPCKNEPSTCITLYQALPKGDKMEYIIQKSVELGVTKIVPVISARCISRPDEKSLNKKQVRWQKIAKEAAQQSRRGIVPTVEKSVTFKQAVQLVSDEKAENIIFYECGGESVKKLVTDSTENINIFIGSEGGFEPQEVEAIEQIGGHRATLGKRILRAETAPLAALSIIMFSTGNFE